MKLGVFLAILAAVWARPSAGDYTYVNYDKIMSKLDQIRIGSANNHLFKVYDGFQKFRINPRPKCGQEVSYACKNPIIEIANFQKGPQFVSTLPTVLLIGGFHGDEVVGSNALYYLIELFEKNYQKDPFYANLLDNVRIMLLPMANVNGFYYQDREEGFAEGGSADPNRDFPFNLQSGEYCFKTSTAMLIDAIFRKNLIVGCITFHGGDNSITYPWGNFAHKNQPLSPDNAAFRSIADMLRKAGSNNPSMGVQTYEIGTMHKVVYDVRGGFEDWAYAASTDKNNVNAACAVNDNPAFDLFKERVSYDLASNRALVYLIEAGYNKIPDEMFLGNDKQLARDSQGEGKWGHVTRNINIALRLAETMRPHAVVTRVAYENSLKVELSVRGCTQIDNLFQEKTPFSELRREINPITNEWMLYLDFNIPTGTTRSISFGIQCDKHFANPTHGQSPITHFVKLRTTNDYFLNYQGNKIRSKNSIRVSILNIRTDSLNNAIIQWNTGNINSITYTNSLRGVPVGKSRQSDQIIHVSYGQGVLHAQTLATAGNNRQKELAVRKYGAMSEKWVRNTPRHLVSIKSGQNEEMSPQHFLTLVGKDVDVYHEKSNLILYTQTLIPDVINSYEEEMNALFIPDSGVNCRSEDLKSPFYFVEIVKSRESDLKFILLTDTEEFYGFRVGNMKHDFELTSSVTFEGRTLSKYQTRITVRELDDMRLLTRKFELFLNKKVTAFTCIMAYRDPQVGQEVAPEPEDETIWVYQTEHNERRNNALILIVFMSFLIALIYYGIRLRQSAFSEKSEKDLQVIIHTAGSMAGQD